jgi:hypothetical protein
LTEFRFCPTLIFRVKEVLGGSHSTILRK